MKILARMKILYDSTADAQGDLDRTSDSFKNTMASMWAMLKRLGEGIGRLIMPVFRSLGQLVGALAEVFSETTEGRLNAVKEVIRSIAVPILLMDIS